jgi:hypothetical protein
MFLIHKGVVVKIKLMIISLLMVSGLQGAQCNSLCVFYPNANKPLITVMPWDDATKEEIYTRTKNSFINGTQFPTGKFALLINENGNNFHVEKFEYSERLNQYEEPQLVKDDLLNVNLQDCSFVVYNGGGSDYHSLSKAAKFINRVDAEKVPCVINYPVENRAAIWPLICNKKVYHFASLKEHIGTMVCIVGVVALFWYTDVFGRIICK